jgi:bacteriocin-like protein
MARPTRLTYQGTIEDVYDEDSTIIGHAPDRFFTGVPARDLAAEDIAQLSDEELAQITGGDDPLYADPDAPAAMHAKASPATAKPAPPSPPSPPPGEATPGS